MSDLCPIHYKATRVQKIDEQVNCVACNAYSDGYTEADRIAKKEIERLRAELKRFKRIAWGVTHNAGNVSRQKQYVWAHVMDATSLGSTSAIELCKEFDVDPYESRGGEI